MEILEIFELLFEFCFEFELLLFNCCCCGCCCCSCLGRDDDFLLPKAAPFDCPLSVLVEWLLLLPFVLELFKALALLLSPLLVEFSCG